jgi:hypothetical protein
MEDLFIYIQLKSEGITLEEIKYVLTLINVC